MAATERRQLERRLSEAEAGQLQERVQKQGAQAVGDVLLDTTDAGQLLAWLQQG